MEFMKLIDSYKKEIIESVQELVRIKSVEEDGKEGKPFGDGPYEALKYILELGESMGFKTKNLDGYAGYIEFGKEEETVGILGHVDVVPEGSGWKYPPYGAEIHEDKIYGRGTIDDKGPLISVLYAMKALKESGVELDKNIRMIVGANEETDWRCMDYYFQHEKAPEMAFTPDADFPVIHAEKGIMVIELSTSINPKDGDVELISLEGGSAPNVVPDSAVAIINSEDNYSLKKELESLILNKEYKASVEYYESKIKIIASGISAHGSTPEKGESAIHTLLAILQVVFDGGGDLTRFIELYNERIGFFNHGEKIGCNFEDDIVGKLSFNPGKIYLKEGVIKILVDIRYPVKRTYEEVYQGISKNLEGENIRIKILDNELLPLYVDKEDPLVEKLMKVYKKETGDINSGPMTIGGGTYARAMDNAVAFGPRFPGMKELAHQKNEYISIDHLMEISRIYTRALYELAR